MSVNSSTSGSPISFSGIVSGLDTSSIIQALLSADQAPITTLTAQETAIQTTQSALSQLQSLVQTVGTDAQNLANPSSFATTTGSSSNTGVATITSSASASAGTYNLSVTQIATANKVASTAQADTTSALNLTGTFVINGTAIDVASTDSLSSIAQKINTANVGVTASLINGGANNSFLTLTSNSTGAANAIQLSDMSGGVMNSLGMLGTSSSIRNPITNGALSSTFSSQSSSIGSLLGANSPPAGSFTINGVPISADFSTDSLTSIAANINAAGAGVTAIVQSVTTNGTTGYQLQIVGTSGTPTITDTNGLLGDMGVMQNTFGDTLVGAQDANYSLDNVSLTSSSNTETNVIPGATLTLLSGTKANPGTSTITLSTDTSGISSQISTFVSDYNAAVNYIAQQTALDPTTYVSGPLFGDFTTEQVQSQLGNMLFNNVPGLSGSMTNLASIGFSLDKNDNLQVNQTTLTSALQSNPAAVGNIFASSGSTTSSDLTYITSTSNTVSNGNPYGIDITQAATQGSYTAEQAQTQANPDTETLTFSGSLFGSTPYNINLNAGNTLAQTISQINSDPTLSKFVVASNNAGSLEITSDQYGTPGNFTVTSNIEAASNNSGIGVGSLGTTVTGLDVAGTINGETANGSGQYLTGASGNATTDGLEVRYSGTATGLVGSVTYSSGIASQLNNTISSMTNTTNGIFESANNAFTQQVTDITAQITAIQAQVAAEQTYLENEFANMESAIASLKNQQASLSSILGTGSNNSSSSSGSTGTTNG